MRTAKARHRRVAAVSLVVLALALGGATAPDNTATPDDKVKTITFEKQVYNDAMGRGAAGCDRKKAENVGNFLSSMFGKTKNMVGSYSISGKFGPQIACMSKAPATEFEAKSEAGVADKTARSVATMEEYKGRYREQLVVAPGYAELIRAKLGEIYADWPANAPRPAVKPDDVAIFIRNDDESNAVSYIDNSLVVNTGLIEQLDEDAFMFALAHEYAHLAAEHPRKDQARMERRQFINSMAETFNLLSFLSATSVNKVGDNQYQTSLDKDKYFKALVRARGAQSAVVYINDRFVEPGWSRSLEDEADALAMDVLLNRDASRADLYLAFFSQRTAWDDLKKELQTKVMDNFEANMKDALKAKKVADAAAKDDLGGWADYSSDYISGQVQKDLRGALAAFLQRDHISDAARRKGLRKYVEAAYGGWPGADTPAPVVEAPPPPPDPPAAKGKGKGKSKAKSGKATTRGAKADKPVNGFAAVKAGAELANLKTLRASMTAYLNAKSSGDVAATAQYVQELKTNPAGDQAYVNYELAVYASEQGDIKSARTYFGKATQSSLAVPRFYLDYASFALRNNDAATAAALSERGKAAFGDPDRFLAIDIAVARAANDSKKVSDLYMQCQRTGREILISECEEAFDPTRDHKQVSNGGWLGKITGAVGGMTGRKSGT